MTTVSGASDRPLSAHSHIRTLVFMFFTSTQLSAISLDSWVPLYVCVCSWLHPRSLSHFLTTSRVGSSEQLSVSPRVRDQSEAPISPTTTTVDAAGHREGSGLTSCHTDPASQGQNPGPWATVSHCVSFQPSRSHGGLLERGTMEREKKSTQRPRDLFVTCEQWSARLKALLLLAGCLLLALLTGLVVAVVAEPVDSHYVKW